MKGVQFFEHHGTNNNKATRRNTFDSVVSLSLFTSTVSRVKDLGGKEDD